MVVHEHCQVQPLVTAKKEGEDVRLPKLVRRCTFEPSLEMLAGWRCRRPLCQEPFLMQDAPHLRL
jgi:hypothetical protein